MRRSECRNDGCHGGEVVQCPTLLRFISLPTNNVNMLELTSAICTKCLMITTLFFTSDCARIIEETQWVNLLEWKIRAFTFGAVSLGSVLAFLSHVLARHSTGLILPYSLDS